jgi:hypothetical protein
VAETITVADYVAFFHQFLGFADNPVLAPGVHERCRCRRFFIGGDVAGTFNCLQSSQLQLVLRSQLCVFEALEGICYAAGYSRESPPT